MQPPLSPVPAMPSLRPVPPPHVDMSRFTDALAAVRRAMAPVADHFRRATRELARVGRTLHALANDPVRVAGLEARYMVRAGLDPLYADPARLDVLVRMLLDHGGAPDDMFREFLSPANRRRLAVAAIRGWVGSHVKRGA